MKKAACILLFLLLALITQAALVDDFESYATGPISLVTGGNWVPHFVTGGGTNPGNDSAVRSIAADPTDASNQVLYLETNNSGQYGMYGVFPAGVTIANNTIGTLFVRFYATTTALDESLGLTTVDVPTGGFANFNCQVALNRGNILVRNLAANTDVGDLVANTWYYMWIVVNNTTNTYSVYLKTTAANATSADLVASNFAYRTIGTNNPDGDIDRFLTVANYGTGLTAGTRLHFDDIVVSAGEDLSIPAAGKPYNPLVTQSPDGANNDIDVTLQWDAGMDPNEIAPVNPAIVNEYIFMGSGTDPNLYYISETGVDPVTVPSSFGPIDRVPGVTYKWAIVEAISGHEQTFMPMASTLADVNAGNIVGPVWTFTTMLLVPEFTGQPVDQWVFPAGDPENPAGTAVFSVTLRDTNGVSYQWYKGTTPLSDGGNISGATTATLTISNSLLADEGTYFCRAHNSAGDSDSTGAILRIKRLTSHYPLETDVLDAVSDFDITLSQEAASAGLAALVAGGVNPSVSGYSLQFDNGDHATDPNGQYATVATGVVDYPDITVSTWVKWDGGANWQRIFDFGTDTTHYMFLTPSNGSECRFVLNNGSGEQVVATGPLVTGEWTFVACTVEGSTGILYVNGETRTTNTAVSINPSDIDPTLNYIGKSQYPDPEFDGLLDEFKIYSYARTPMQVAEEYHSLSGNDPCVNAAFEGSRYNLDNTGSSYCKVDLADFAVLTEGWMTDGLYEPLP